MELDVYLEERVKGGEGFSTLRELLPAYKDAMKLVDKRQEDYGDSWVREGLSSSIGSLFRKASGIDFMYKDGIYNKKMDKFKEDLLDLMNYSAIAYTLLNMEERK